MPVFRVERNEGYAVISNYHLWDKSLSLKANGLWLAAADFVTPGWLYIVDKKKAYKKVMPVILRI